MLKDSEPADYSTYYYNNFPVRVHFHTDNHSIWIVAKDLCDALHITNASYVSGKLDSEDIIRHKILNSKNRRKVLWISLKAVHFLTAHSSSTEGKGFYVWLLSQVNSDYISVPKELLLEIYKTASKINSLLHIN